MCRLDSLHSEEETLQSASWQSCNEPEKTGGKRLRETGGQRWLTA